MFLMKVQLYAVPMFQCFFFSFDILFTYIKMETKKMKVGFCRYELGHIKWNKMKSITFWKPSIYLAILMAFTGKWIFVGPTFQNTVCCLQNLLQLTQT